MYHLPVIFHVQNKFLVPSHIFKLIIMIMKKKEKTKIIHCIQMNLARSRKENPFKISKCNNIIITF